MQTINLKKKKKKKKYIYIDEEGKIKISYVAVLLLVFGRFNCGLMMKIIGVGMISGTIF